VHNGELTDLYILYIVVGTGKSRMLSWPGIVGKIMATRKRLLGRKRRRNFKINICFLGELFITVSIGGIWCQWWRLRIHQ
jgi:hypothetical protein